MEAFEQFVALAMETEGLVVGGATRYPFARLTRKASHAETQTHSYEVDLVGARRDRLVLASVKSYFGSQGVNADHLGGKSANRTLNARYMLLNDGDVRASVVAQAAEQYGFEQEQVELRLYVGRFAPGRHEAQARDWAASQHVGGGPIRIIGAADVVAAVRPLAQRTAYRDSAVITALKVMEATGMLRDPAGGPLA